MKARQIKIAKWFITVIAALTIGTFAGCDQDGNTAPPVSFSYSGSWIGAGIVLHIQNNSSGYIENLTITIERNGRVIKTAGIAEKFGPRETKDVGWMEIGVTIQKTDVITLHAKGYPRGNTLIPQ